MTKHARRVAAVALVFLCVPFLVFAIFRDSFPDQPTQLSYYSRCGGRWTLFWLTCRLSASLACLTAAAFLGYQAWSRAQREPGHSLNRITLRYVGFMAVAAASFAMFLVGFVPGLNTLCAIQPLIDAATAFTAGGMAYQTILETPRLQQMPHFEFAEIEAELRDAAALTDDQRFRDALEFIEKMRRHQEGAE